MHPGPSSHLPSPTLLPVNLKVWPPSPLLLRIVSFPLSCRVSCALANLTSSVQCQVTQVDHRVSECPTVRLSGCRGSEGGDRQALGGLAWEFLLLRENAMATGTIVQNRPACEIHTPWKARHLTLGHSDTKTLDVVEANQHGAKQRISRPGGVLPDLREHCHLSGMCTGVNPTCVKLSTECPSIEHHGSEGGDREAFGGLAWEFSASCQLGDSKIC